MIDGQEKGEEMSLYNIRSVADFIGPILAKEILFEENPELMTEFHKRVEDLADTISVELDLPAHMAKHRTFPLYMGLKPKAEAEFERLKVWARENGLFK